jgi:PIN domain nuclease of toxin-antitoxin system
MSSCGISSKSQLDLLLDTHVFVWAIADSSRLDRLTQMALASSDNLVLVSSVTPWEIAINRELGRLKFPLNLFGEIIERMGFDILPILPAHGIAAGALPRHHGDPFDRMLIAQALTEALTLVTQDRAFLSYDVPVLGVSAP